MGLLLEKREEIEQPSPPPTTAGWKQSLNAAAICQGDASSVEFATGAAAWEPGICMWNTTSAKSITGRRDLASFRAGAMRCPASSRICPSNGATAPSAGEGMDSEIELCIALLFCDE